MQKQQNNNGNNNPKSFQQQTIQPQDLTKIKGGWVITEDWLDL